MASIFKRSGSDRYLISYTAEDGRRRRIHTKTGDKTVAEALAREMERKALLRREGVLCPADERRAGAERNPLSLHLDEYRNYLAAKGDTTTHANKTKARAKKVFDACGADLLSALSVARVQGVLADLRKGGTGLETLNGYRRAVRGFSRWLHREGRTSEDALLGLSGFNAKLDRRWKRRVLNDVELGKLLTETERGTEVLGMFGRDRSVMYRLALMTGLRLSEIRSLRPESFDLDGKPPVVRVQAGYTKNRKEVAQPFPASFVAVLRPWLVEKMQERLRIGPARWRGLFPVTRGAEMLQHDLAKAEIPFRTADGVFDFHSLRGVFGTRLSRTGVNPAVLKDLIRHSDIRTTMTHYVRLSLLDHQAALEAMPSLESAETTSKAERATGTDGNTQSSGIRRGETLPLRETAEIASQNRHHYRHHSGDVFRPAPSSDVTMPGDETEKAAERNPLEMEAVGAGCRASDTNDAGGPAWIRTRDQGIMSPLL